MMRAVSDLTKPYGVKAVASLNSIMVDGPEIDSHIIDWDKFLPRFGQFKPQELASKVKHGLA